MNKEYVYIDRILWPVTSLGPGKRIAIWVSGCGRHCFHCANPELWERKPSQMISVSKVYSFLEELIMKNKPDGLTITGGEPFDQADGLFSLLERLSDDLPEILIYSGYTRDEIVKDDRKNRLLSKCSVLIDGPYVDEQNEPSVVLRGSANQRIYYLDPCAETEYLPYIRKGRQIQNYVYDYRILSVGIHSRTEEQHTGDS